MAMIDPRESFLKSTFGKTWLDVVDSAQFQSAAQTALAQMQINGACPPDLASAAAGQWRMEGAKIFLQTLMSLTEPARQANRPTGINLNHIP